MKLNLLYLEDDLEVRENVVYFLERLFSNIYTATDGDEAYDIYCEKQIDILLLDINVPKMNGITLSKKVRENNYKIPIIFLSAYSDRGRLLEVLKIGVTSYIVKPFIFKELLETMSKTIQLIIEEKKTTDKVMLGLNLTWDENKKSLIYLDEVIHLTHNEILLTELFTSYQNKIFTLHEINEELFNHNNLHINTIIQLISRFKRKIVKITDNNHFFIENIYKQGYKFR